MSQTTCCPSCDTLFKVVPDQLRMSDGWVRCGQCSEVFDATLSLQEDVGPASFPVPEPETETAPSEPTPIASTLAGAFLGKAQPDTLQAAALSAGVGEGAGGRSAGAPPHAGVLADLPASKETAPAPVPMADTEPGEWSETGADERTLQEAMPLHPGADARTDTDTEIDLEPEPEPELLQDGATLRAPQLEGYELPAAVLPEEDGGAEAQAAPEPETEPEPEPVETEEQEETEAAPETQAQHMQALEAAGPGLAQDAVSGAGHEAEHPAPGPDLHASRWEAEATPSETPLPPLEDPSAPLPVSAPAPAAQRLAGTFTETHEEGGTVSVLPAAHEPSFVRSARRKALWHRPAVRLALGGCTLVLAATLLAQVAVQQRHYLASARPQWRPVLEALCLPLQCDLRPYRHIASVAVDSSSFNKLQGSTYRFALALKNQSSLEVALPAVELTLTDASEQLLLRRVFTPAQLAAPAMLPPDGEWMGTLDMDLQLPGKADARIAGYRVLAFYP